MTEQLTEKTLERAIRLMAYSVDPTPETRRRFSKEIAEELIATKGAFAHLHALEKLDGYVSDDLRELWRDVLIWLDELEQPNGEQGDTHINGRGGEQASSPKDDC